ncbi:hypothetical protein LEP1GSC074_1660 [Leptospira noguchii str. Hook]|nr:hypothetical protein LEP1GSC074_1660 [Leptospira noguchii str. Hook]
MIYEFNIFQKRIQKTRSLLELLKNEFSIYFCFMETVN